MFVRSSDFDPSLTQAQVDAIINSLAVNAYDFSTIACLDGRMYGVTTKCEQCSLEINYCVRNELSRILYATQQMAERDLNYDISPRYHVADIPFGYMGKLRLPHRNVELLNVEQTYTIPTGYDSIAVNPYIQENITVQTIDGKCVATFSSSLVDNPNKAIIRDENGKLYEHEEVAGYPKRSGGNWQIVIRGNPNPCSSGLDFHVQHCELIRVTMVKPACTGTLRPVYPNTSQIIPTFKIEDDGTNLTFWFHVWTLARPEFMDDGIDFSKGDFYKLFDTIDAMCFRDTTKNAVVTVMTPDDCAWEFTSSDTVPAVTILDAEMGLVYVDTKLLDCSTCGFSLINCNQEYPARIKIWYKTNPQVMTRNPFPITATRNAICYYAAAELPTSACACTLTEGFIFQAQTAFVEKRVNPFDGSVVENMTYRDVYGRVRYKEIMCNVPTYKNYGSL